MSRTASEIPGYLRRYLCDREAKEYTSVEHATWRFIMRQSRQFFHDNAVPIYLEGLEKTGITIDRIPTIAAMDKKLRDIGWGAVPVSGFIPPAAFLDFQARRILPIATDMRTLDHVHYTPAPDIVHEAAGHAPILADPKYSEYLQAYAAMARRAIFSKEDLNLYESIRTLSDVKENPDSTAEQIAAAEQELKDASAAMSFVSEANKTARMNWWTVEYGLLGPLDNPKIYGAGLLSSVGESQNCLSGSVRKIPLTVACVEQTYDITEPQPQLFVAESIDQLTEVLREFDASLSYRQGGVYGLNQALVGETVTTTQLNGRVQVSGRLVEFIEDGGEVEFVKFAGPVQISIGENILLGQGRAQHAEGFSSPVGRWKSVADRPPNTLDADALRHQGIREGERAKLEFCSGFVVEGAVTQIQYDEGLLAVIKWRDCTVKRGEAIYFDPSWGEFDMVVGDRVTSVFGGPADREDYGDFDVGTALTSPARQSPYSVQEKQTFAVYQELRDKRDRWRAGQPCGAEELEAFCLRVRQEYPDEWLLRLEALELMKRHWGHEMEGSKYRSIIHQTEDELRGISALRGGEIGRLIDQGIAMSSEPDY